MRFAVTTSGKGKAMLKRVILAAMTCVAGRGRTWAVARGGAAKLLVGMRQLEHGLFRCIPLARG